VVKGRKGGERIGTEGMGENISPEINFWLRPCVRCQNLQLVCRHTVITITVGKSIITASDDDDDDDDDGGDY